MQERTVSGVRNIFINLQNAMCQCIAIETKVANYKFSLKWIERSKKNKNKKKKRKKSLKILRNFFGLNPNVRASVYVCVFVCVWIGAEQFAINLIDIKIHAERKRRQI